MRGRLAGMTMRRVFYFLVNNIREHLMLYLTLSMLLAIADLLWLYFS